MSDTFYGTGITVASGFDLGAKAPLDSRIVVNTIEERDAHVTNNRAYDGMIVYVKEDNTTYQYLKEEWVIFGAEVIDNLGSTSVIKGLSANQGRVLDEKITELQKEVENVDGKVDNINIPTRVSQLTNDLNYTTKEYVDEKVGQGGGGSGNANIHVGDEEPVDKTYLWIDTTAPCTLDPNTYEGRLRLNYISMLNKTLAKTAKIEQGITLITSKIQQISSDKASVYSEQLSEIKSTLSNLKMEIMTLQSGLNLGQDLNQFKTASKRIKKEVRNLFFLMSDLKNDVLSLLDSENMPDASVLGGGDSDDPATGNALLTESGEYLLTEDGLIILLDGVNSSEILADAILTELGLVLLTEDGKQILKG